MQSLNKNSLWKLLTTDYKYAFMLLYWPLFGICFWILELMPYRNYHCIESSLDALIPFSEWFLIPYFFWFIYIIGSVIYFFFNDKDVFIKYMWHVALTYTTTLVVYVVYPTSQPLRPVLTDEGILYDIVRWLYGYDTSTNVCPSLHVIGSFSVMFAALKCTKLSKPVIRAGYVVIAVFICASTVFLKQHSIIDVFWGVVVACIGYPFSFTDNKISCVLRSLFEPTAATESGISVS